MFRAGPGKVVESNHLLFTHTKQLMTDEIDSSSNFLFAGETAYQIVTLLYTCPFTIMKELKRVLVVLQHLYAK